MNTRPILSCLWIILLLLGSFGESEAQKNDYIWLAGYGSTGGGYDSSCQCRFDVTKFDFNQPTVNISYDSLGLNFDFTNEAISDSAGQLLFYSNGVMVYNYLDQLIQNGDSLGWGPEFTYLNPQAFISGLPFSQMLLTLPNPQVSGTYDIFYIYIDSITNTPDLLPNKLLRARIDMNANGGQGAVIQKDVVVMEQALDLTITATRHGNGRDWWICTNQVLTNCHNVMLYTGSDTLQTLSQCSGQISPFDDAHACRFSPDGNFYITTNDSGQVNVFNFDRCTGSLNLYEEFFIPEIATSQSGPSGLEFSPNSRFFYIFCSSRIFQYDLTVNPIVDSKDTIASYHYPGHFPADYFWGQLAPDGKIYIDGGSSSYYISAIDSPNGKGSTCNFLDQSIEMPSLIVGLPYYPNYRLGALNQSQCDSLSTATQTVRDAQEQILKLFPNPASDIATVDYGFTDWNKGAVSLEVTNELGQIIYAQPLPMYSGFQRLDISRYAAGMYTVCMKRNGGVVATQKLVVQH